MYISIYYADSCVIVFITVINLLYLCKWKELKKIKVTLLGDYIDKKIKLIKK